VRFAAMTSYLASQQVCIVVYFVIDSVRNFWIQPRVCTPGKEPRYALSRGLGGPQSKSERGGKKKNPQVLPGIEPRSSSP
jgi:hypothetical protein